jgi:acetylornithine deacetylase/succinyl-diaminopimelate desuccinylase-like protein
MSAKVQAWLDERAEEMAALLDALVRVPTENPPGRELGRCAVRLRDALEGLGCAAPSGAAHGSSISTRETGASRPGAGGRPASREHA